MRDYNVWQRARDSSKPFHLLLGLLSSACGDFPQKKTRQWTRSICLGNWTETSSEGRPAYRQFGFSILGLKGHIENPVDTWREAALTSPNSLVFTLRAGGGKGERRERERNGVAAAAAAMTKVEKRGGEKDRQKTSRLNLRLFPDN